MVTKTNILVYAHWKGMSKPKKMGVLQAVFSRGKTSYSFEYDKQWLLSEEHLLIDPDIQWYSGIQFPSHGNFGIFLDSMPDTWGRTLMKRRAILNKMGANFTPLHEIDYLLGVYDEARMGALRFKLEEKGDFLSNENKYPIPPWSSVRELQYGANIAESDKDEEETRKWLTILIAPGSSLGGARPKANILDTDKQLWIAKFPSKNDDIDKALWEYLSYRLAKKAGIIMAESKVEKVAGKYHTFFTKRFDRDKNERIHFASAMTMLGKNEQILRDEPASYLDIAEFIQFHCDENEKDLHQLWRRIVFNICISNTDDHLRNHGFLLQAKSWRLSPAYDLNPSIDKNGLSLNIDSENNALSIELAKNVGHYFMLDSLKMDKIITEVTAAIRNWKAIAKEIGIPRKEQTLMAAAFRCE